MKPIALAFLLCSTCFITGCGEKNKGPGQQDIDRTVDLALEKQQLEQDLTAARARETELKSEIQKNKNALANLKKSLSELESENKLIEEEWNRSHAKLQMEHEKMGYDHLNEPPHVIFRKVTEAWEAQITENQQLRQKVKELEK